MSRSSKTFLAGAGEGAGPLDRFDGAGEQLGVLRVGLLAGVYWLPRLAGLHSGLPGHFPGGRGLHWFPAHVRKRLRVALLQERHHGFADEAAQVKKGGAVPGAHQDPHPY